MDKQIQLADISRRNTQSFQDALHDLNKKIFDQQAQINAMASNIAMLISEVSILRNQLNMQKVQMTRLGPSVKG